MTQMKKSEIRKLIQENPNLREYLVKYNMQIKPRIDKPLMFYHKLPFDLKNEKYPNVIYVTKGSIFVHVFRANDMEEPEYHAIEPLLNEQEQLKYTQILELIPTLHFLLK